MPLTISSSAFENGGSIPAKYTCDASLPVGKQIPNPPLQINGVPESAKSLVLIMDDPDIPDFVKTARGIEVFDHWVVFNIPPNTGTIEEGKNPEGIVGANSVGENKYRPCCPPDREHHYFFKLYALDSLLSLALGATKKEVEKAMEGHILEKAELVGLYKKQ